MERAVALGNISISFPMDLRDKLLNVSGVVDANFIYGPYDFYVIVEAETEEELMDVTARIRGIEGVASTMTCRVISPEVPMASVKE